MGYNILQPVTDYELVEDERAKFEKKNKILKYQGSQF